MKKAIKVFLFMLFIIYSSFKLWIRSNYHCKDLHAYYYEEKAKNHNTFVAKFKIIDADNSVKDSLVKYDYLPILDTLTFLVERVHRNCPKYLFFFERKVQEKKLIYFSPLAGNCENIRKRYDKIGRYGQPDLFFQLDQDNTYSGSYFKSPIVINQQDLEHIGIENGTKLQLYAYLAEEKYPPYDVVKTLIGTVTLSCVESIELGQSSTIEFHWIAPDIPEYTIKCY